MAHRVVTARNARIEATLPESTTLNCTPPSRVLVSTVVNAFRGSTHEVLHICSKTIIIAGMEPSQYSRARHKSRFRRVRFSALTLMNYLRRESFRPRSAGRADTARHIDLMLL